MRRAASREGAHAVAVVGEGGGGWGWCTKRRPKSLEHSPRSSAPSDRVRSRQQRPGGGPPDATEDDTSPPPPPRGSRTPRTCASQVRHKTTHSITPPPMQRTLSTHDRPAALARARAVARTPARRLPSRVALRVTERGGGCARTFVAPTVPVLPCAALRSGAA